jgi:ELWxxDGT repeat protein
LTRLASKLSLLFVAAALGGSPLDAQVASLVADLNVDPIFGFGTSSDPRFFVQLPSRVVFVASDPNAGVELWTTDATPHGTELLADICPGGCSSDPFLLGAAGGVSFWSVEDEDRASDRALWRSDGTRAGTYRLAPGVAVPGSPSGTAQEFAVVGNRLFFVGCVPEAACELWRSDGTLAGTRAVGIAATPLTWFTAVGDKLFFVGEDENDVALWVSDGTPGGTSLLRRFEYPYPHALVGNGTRLFFIGASQGSAPFTADFEIWVSDGTSAGTRQASQLTPDSALATTGWLKPLGGFVYFIADDVIHGQETWRSDGTADGTRRVTDFGYHLPLGSDYGGDIDPRSLEELGGKLLFLASDGLTPPKLWTTDGEPTSTAPLADACTSRCPDTSIGGRLLKAGGRVYFSASDEEHGAELWVTDGTAVGTTLIRDVCPGPCSGSVSGALLAAARSSSPERTTASRAGSGTPMGRPPALARSASSFPTFSSLSTSSRRLRSARTCCSPPPGRKAMSYGRATAAPAAPVSSGTWPLDRRRRLRAISSPRATHCSSAPATAARNPYGTAPARGRRPSLSRPTRTSRATPDPGRARPQAQTASSSSGKAPLRGRSYGGPTALQRAPCLSSGLTSTSTWTERGSP